MTEVPSIAAKYPNCRSVWHEMLTVAMYADCAPSTHPIQVGIKHTGDATSAFDAISYRKGASWIKTMDNFIGRSALQAGLKEYISKFAYKNTVLNDLVACIDTDFSSSLGEDFNFIAWTDDWLKTTGLNTVELKTTMKNADGKLQLDIVQGTCKYGSEIYREQCIDVLLFGKEGKQVLLENIRLDKKQVTEQILKQVD